MLNIYYLIFDYRNKISSLILISGFKFFRNLNRQSEMKPLCAYTACQVMTESQLMVLQKTKKKESKTKKEYKNINLRCSSGTMHDRSTGPRPKRKLTRYLLSFSLFYFVLFLYFFLI